MAYLDVDKRHLGDNSADSASLTSSAIRRNDGYHSFSEITN